MKNRCSSYCCYYDLKLQLQLQPQQRSTSRANVNMQGHGWEMLTPLDKRNRGELPERWVRLTSLKIEVSLENTKMPESINNACIRKRMMVGTVDLESQLSSMIGEWKGIGKGWRPRSLYSALLNYGGFILQWTLLHWSFTEEELCPEVVWPSREGFSHNYPGVLKVWDFP